jgi:nicotinamide mononucleotide transporter
MNASDLLAMTFQVGATQVSLGDALGFVTGLLCVWLTAKANIWNFPMGILNSLILGFVFLEQRLFADSALQLVFIALSIQGWFQWSARKQVQRIQFRSTSLKEQIVLTGVALALTLLIWSVLVQLRGSAPPLDALITALSLCAQWQLNRRQVSSWIWWIAVDLISVPLYWSRGLYLIAGLYVIFLAICVHGLQNWRRANLIPARAVLA